MKAKKVLAITLVTAMTIGMLAGCGTSGNDGKDSASDRKSVV